MVNSQIPLLTGQPSVDVELLQNNALSIPGWSVEGGIWEFTMLWTSINNEWKFTSNAASPSLGTPCTYTVYGKQPLNSVTVVKRLTVTAANSLTVVHYLWLTLRCLSLGQEVTRHSIWRAQRSVMPWVAIQKKKNWLEFRLEKTACTACLTL